MKADWEELVRRTRSLEYRSSFDNAILAKDAELADHRRETDCMLTHRTKLELEIERLQTIVDLAADYIEGQHDYHLHCDFPTVRVPIAQQKREALRIALEGLDTGERM